MAIAAALILWNLGRSASRKAALRRV